MIRLYPRTEFDRGPQQHVPLFHLGTKDEISHDIQANLIRFRVPAIS
ncbi:MAG: hypothetical protein P8J27_09655 [Mariniblastus sp.]|nr:hypothetical protein [Mariniblastus sp.]